MPKWQHGDVGALDRLPTQIHPMIYQWAFVSATNIDEADDIAQHVLITAYRNLRQFRGFAPLALVGLILLGVVIVALVTAFIWRP
ncbi:MAG: RNA polymerase sigma factor [Gemmatimonadaceae bacterium]